MTVRYTFIVSNFTHHNSKKFLSELFATFGFESVQISTSFATNTPYAYLTLSNIGNLEDFLKHGFLNQDGKALSLHFISKKTIDDKDNADKRTRRLTLG